MANAENTYTIRFRRQSDTAYARSIFQGENPEPMDRAEIALPPRNRTVQSWKHFPIASLMSGAGFWKPGCPMSSPR
ncbi:MAG: hypothetical protein JJU00_02745 [Opitutales bacterium]|nr:hypothetical protein [Opitutales bacterium]